MDVQSHPPAMWAQRNDVVYLTLLVECREPTVTFTNDSVFFEGECAPPDKQRYSGTIRLYADVDPERCAYTNRGRIIEMTLVKREPKGTFWPRLTKDNAKPHWLRLDFARMQEENDSDEENENKASLEDMMRDMGCLDDMKDKPGFDDGETDSDDDAIPDLDG